jgi:hypothetical protein
MTALRPDLQTIVDKIIALRRMTKSKGFQANRTEHGLLRPLNEEDLSDVALALADQWGK